MIAIAHRGASALKTENTFEAFALAIKMGSKWFETDVQRTQDGVLVLYHDFSLRGRAIPETVYPGSGLTRLDELLDILPHDGILNIEIKEEPPYLYPGIAAQILALLDTYELGIRGRILISSFHYPVLQEVRALDKDIKIGVLTRKFDLSQVLAVNAYSVNINKNRVTADIVKACHENGLKVLVYTVNDKEEAKRMEAMGVDGIFSDFPDILAK